MEGKKISQLIPDTSPTTDDFIVTVDGTTLQNKRVDLGNLPVSNPTNALKVSKAGDTMTGRLVMPSTEINGVLYLSGTGFPNGVVSAPVGSIYIDKNNTNGASSWVKKSGTGNTGWVVLEGDTGTINMYASLLNGWASGGGRFNIRRVGNTVIITASIANGINGSDATNDIFMAIPSGFSVQGQAFYNHDVLGTGYVNFGGGSAAIISRRFGNIGTASRVNGLGFILRYQTTDPWPTTLP